MLSELDRRVGNHRSIHHHSWWDEEGTTDGAAQGKEVSRVDEFFTAESAKYDKMGRVGYLYYQFCFFFWFLLIFVCFGVLFLLFVRRWLAFLDFVCHLGLVAPVILSPVSAFSVSQYSKTRLGFQVEKWGNEIETGSSDWSLPEASTSLTGAPCRFST